MFSKYLDLFIRSNLEEINDLPRSCETLFDSPDVIAWGDSPADDPVILFSGNYDQNVAKDITYGQDNYIYVRAKNFKNGAQTGTVIVYSSSKSNLTSPGAWIRLTTPAGNNSVPVTVEKEGNIAVTADPFVWRPDEPSNENPFSLIAVVYTKDDPNPVGPDTDQIDIQDLVANNGGVGWVEYAVPKPPEKGLTSTSTTAVALDNAEGDDLSFMVSCNNVPVGAQIAFFSDKNDSNGDPISLPRTTITTPNMESSIPLTLDANYSANITLELYAKGVTATDDYSLTFECMKSTGSGMTKKIISLGGFSTGILLSKDT